MATRQPRLEANMIAPVMQPFVIDRSMAQCVGSPVNQEDWATRRNLHRQSNGRFSGGFQLVFSLDKRRVVSRLQQSENGFRGQIVCYDFAAEVLRQTRLVEGKRHAVGKADTPDLHHARPRDDRELIRSAVIGRNNVSTDYTACRGEALSALSRSLGKARRMFGDEASFRIASSFAACC